MSIHLSDASKELLENLGLDNSYATLELESLDRGESRYSRDLRVNVSNAFKAQHLTEKEEALLALCLATNAHNAPLKQAFTERSQSLGATPAEIAEAIACASLLASNNVLYRFRHFADKEVYNQMPARIKMNIMLRPVTGKEFFELMSLAVSAVNGCEQCVRSHEQSLIELGTSEQRIFEAIRLSAVLTGLSKVVH